ncbi:MAG: MBL fold metallo-hydrolase, partial [Pseudomonadota bacterium]
GYLAAQKKIWSIADDDTKIIPGHGALTDKAGMKSDIDVLVEGRALVKALLDDGMSADEIVAANPLQKFHDDYNWAFITTERMTRTFIRALTSE